jgi:hypothetical protein
VGGIMLVLDAIATIVGTRLERELSELMEVVRPTSYTHYGAPGPRVPPTHYTTEGGGSYSARPDLSRAGGPGTYNAIGFIALTVGVIYTSAVIIQSYGFVVEKAPAHERPGMWQTFSQGLTGTGVGVGSGIKL